jgi:hypothetical protein
MALTKIERHAVPQSFGPYSLGAALLSAAMIAQASVQDPQRKDVDGSGARWEFAGPANPFFGGFPSSQYAQIQQASLAQTRASFDESWAELETLPADWDANGAEPIARQTIQYAKDFALSIGLSFDPFAHPNGSVGIENQGDDKSAHIVISPKNRFAYVLRVGKAVHRGNDVDADSLRKVIALLY